MGYEGGMWGFGVESGATGTLREDLGMPKRGVGTGDRGEDVAKQVWAHSCRESSPGVGVVPGWCPRVQVSP